MSNEHTEQSERAELIERMNTSADWQLDGVAPGGKPLVSGSDLRKAAALLSSDAKPVQDGERAELTAAQHRMLHDFPSLQQFHTKHALGPMRPPSCLCCGQQIHPITRPISVRHMELPGIVICKMCYDAAMLAAHKPAESGGEVVAWCVYCDGQFTLNIFQVEAVARAEKARLDHLYPGSIREVVALYTKPQADKVGGEVVAFDHYKIVVDALSNLLSQVEKFCVEHGEADFETGEALRAMELVCEYEGAHPHLHPQPQPSALPDDVVKDAERYFPPEFEVWQGDEMCASASGPRDEALREAMRYAAQYEQDGPVRVFEVTRTFIDASMLKEKL